MSSADAPSTPVSATPTPPSSAAAAKPKPVKPAKSATPPKEKPAKAEKPPKVAKQKKLIADATSAPAAESDANNNNNTDNANAQKKVRPPVTDIAIGNAVARHVKRDLPRPCRYVGLIGRLLNVSIDNFTRADVDRFVKSCRAAPDGVVGLVRLRTPTSHHDSWTFELADGPLPTVKEKPATKITAASTTSSTNASTAPATNNTTASTPASTTTTATNINTNNTNNTNHTAPTRSEPTKTSAATSQAPAAAPVATASSAPTASSTTPITPVVSSGPAPIDEMARVVELAVRSTSGKFVRGMTAYSILKRAGFSKNQVEEFFGYVEHHSGVGKIISVPDADRLRRAKWAFLLPDQSASAAPAVAAAAPVSIKPRMLTVSEPFLVLRGQLEADSAQSWILAQLAVGIKTIGHDANGDYMLRAVLVSTPLPGDWSRRGIYVFDMAEAETRAKFAQTLLTVLSSPNVAKVFHDARLDGDALRRLLSRETSKFVMKSVVDTQMMFAMLVEANVVHLRTPAKLPFASLEDALMALALPVARVTDDASRTVHERWKAPAPLTAALLSSVEQRFLEPLLGLHARLVRQFDVNVGLLSSMNVRWFGAQASVTVPGKPALVGEVHALSFSANDNNARPSTRVQVVLEPLSECGGRPSARGLPPPDEATRNRQMDETTELLSSLPRNVYDAIWSLCDGDVVQLSTNLAEVRMECGRPATLVWRTGATQELPYELVESDFLRFTSAVISENGFTLRADNRVAMSRLLHRVSVARDSQLQIAHARACVRLHHAGTAALLQDVVSRMLRDKTSVLVLGAHGSGRSTLLREFSSALAEQLPQVDVVDTNGDIGGDGEQPHASLGKARRVVTRAANRTTPDALASTLSELASKRPAVVVVDDISTAMQCESLRQLASGGASVVASAFAPSLEALCQRNASVGALLGYRKAPTVVGKQAAILALFGMVIELRAFGEVLVHEQVSASVSVLQGVELKAPATVSHRWVDVKGRHWCRMLQRGGPQRAQAAQHGMRDSFDWLAEQ